MAAAGGCELPSDNDFQIYIERSKNIDVRFGSPAKTLDIKHCGIPVDRRLYGEVRNYTSICTYFTCSR